VIVEYNATEIVKQECVLPELRNGLEIKFEVEVVFCEAQNFDGKLGTNRILRTQSFDNLPNVTRRDPWSLEALGLDHPGWPP